MKYLTSLILSILLLTACQQKVNQQNNATEKYTCPMHPQVVKDQPGTCPICHMDLVKMQETGNNEIVLDQRQIQLANIQTIKPNKSTLGNQKIINGRVVSNPESISVISSKFEGRVDKLNFKEAGAQIKKGDALFSIYSEELLSLQNEYLLNLKQVESFPNESIYQKLLAASINKLKLYGLSANTIKNLNSKKQSPYIVVYAEKSGFIKELMIAEGEYVKEGSPVFTIESLDTIWIEGDLYNNETVTLNQTIKVQIENFEPQPAKVEFVSPQYNENSQLYTFRASLTNKNLQYYPGMRATVSLDNSMTNKKILIPNTALIREENQHYIWIKNGDKFNRKLVRVISENENGIELRENLENEEIVINGAYLLNSEYILKKKNNN